MRTLFIILVIMLNSNLLYTQWQQTSLNNQPATSFLATDSIIFVGIYDSGVFRSTNNGLNWTQTSLNNQIVLSLASDGNNIFAGSNGVFLSTNYGMNWTQTSLIGYSVYALAYSNNNLLAGCAGGVFLSTNNGQNWTLTSLDSINVRSLCVNGNNIFAGTYQGVFISTNNGQNWSHTSLNNYIVDALVTNGSYVFAGLGFPDSGVFLSTNNGQNWSHTSLNSYAVYALVVNNSNIFAGIGNPNSGVFISTNNGLEWIQRNEGMGNQIIYTLATSTNYIYCGTNDHGVFRRLLSDFIGIKPISNSIPNDFSLSQNYPNPFNPSTTIEFALPKSSDVKLVVYDISGREVDVLVNEKLQAGNYKVDFPAPTGDGSKLSSGVYFYMLSATGEATDLPAERSQAGYTETKKMVLIK